MHSKIKFILFCYFLIVLSLHAIPTPMYSIPDMLGKTDSDNIISLTSANNQIYLLNLDKNSIIRYNPASKESKTIYKDKTLLAKPVDITSDDKYLYVLEADNSQIVMIDFDGKLVRTISTAGSPECEFKNPIRILVNFLGTIYVLDKVRNQILSFTNEGLFLKAYSCTNPISMTISIDQNIRLLRGNEKRYQIDVVSPGLTFQSFILLQGFNSDKDELVDIAANDYGETYLVNLALCQICKVDDAGNIIPKSGFGSKAKKVSMGIFNSPSRVLIVSKRLRAKDFPLFAIIDTQIIQFFEDRECNATKLLQFPPWSMRVALLETDKEHFIDYLAADTLRFYIKEFAGSGGMFASTYRNLYCENSGSIVYEIKGLDSKNKKKYSFDTMTLIGDSLFVTDPDNNAVNVFDRLTGKQLSRFGEKGSENGQFKSPSGITHDNDNNLFVCDTDNNRISVWSRYGIFMRNITKTDVIISPSQILFTNEDKFMILCNRKSIVVFDPQTNKSNVFMTRESISSIDYFFLNQKNLLTVVDESTQNILFYEGNKEVLRFGAVMTKPSNIFFRKINAIRYNPLERILYLSDLTAQRTKQVKFYLPTVTPENLKLVPTVASDSLSDNQGQIAKLIWDANANTQRWVVYAFSETDTSYYSTEVNQLVLDNPTKTTISYEVLSVSEDNRFSEATPLIIDDYSYARYLEKAGNNLQAIDVYQKFSSSNQAFNIRNDIFRNYYALAQSSLSQRDFDNAITYLKSSCIYTANPDTIVTKIVKIYKQMAAWQSGISYLLSLNSNTAFVKREMLTLLYLSEDYPGAASCAEDLLKTDISFKDNQEVLQYLASAKENLHLYAEALDAYQQILTLNPSLQNQIKVADLQIKIGSYDDAIALLQKMSTGNPQTNADQIQYMLGLSNLGKKLYVRASDYFSEALRLNSTNADFYYAQGYSYLKDRKTADAIRNLTKAHELMPDNFTYGFELAQLYDKDSRLNEALELLDNIRAYVPEDSSASSFHLFYGNVLMQKKRYDDAYRELLAALKMHPSNQEINDKLKEVVLARTQYNLDREPLEIKKTEFEQIYPSLLEYYKTHPIGYITLFNTRSIPITDIKITVNVSEITALPFEKIIPSVLAGDEMQIDIILDFASRLPQLCELSSQDFIANVTVDYEWDKTAKSATGAETITALKVQAMNWNNRNHLACFINSEDENIRNYGVNILNVLKVTRSDELPKNIVQAMQIYSWLSAKGIRYLSDPAANNATNNSIDYVQFPYQTMQNKGGDCDDLLVMFSSILSSIGVPAAFIDLPEHVVPAFDTGMELSDIEKYGFNRADFIIRGNTIWMPLEMTLIGKESFYRSWKSSVDLYQKTMESGILPDFFVFSDAQVNYPPVKYLKPIEADGDAFTQTAISMYTKDWDNMANAGNLSIEEEFLNTLKLYPENLSYKNRFALWYVEIGKIDKAKNVWTEILKTQPTNSSALINLGNLELMGNQYKPADAYYQQALVSNPLQKDNILRNLCILEYRAGNIVSARDYFKQILDSSTLRRLNPEIYQELLQ